MTILFLKIENKDYLYKRDCNNTEVSSKFYFHFDLSTLLQNVKSLMVLESERKLRG